jgi:hypothetical protein
MVFGDILNRNYEYIKTELGDSNDIKPLPKDWLHNELFKYGFTKNSDNELYKILTSISMRKKHEDNLGVHIELLNSSEQLSFLNFLSSVTVDKINLLHEFTKQYGINGMRTFLSLDKLGEEFGDSIVEFGNMFVEKSQKNYGEIIFKHYADLIDTIDGIEEYLQETFGKNVKPETLKVVADGVRTRAARFLQEIISQPLGNTSETGAKIGEALQRAKDDTVLFASAFRALKLEDEIDWESIKGVSLDTVSSAEVRWNERYKDQMEAIMRKNYTQSEFGYPSKFIDAIVDDMKKAIKEDSTTWYLLTKEEDHNEEVLKKVVGFNRFDVGIHEKTGEDVIFFGSFNIDKEFGNSKLGEAILEASLGEQAELGKPIYAYCNPESPIYKKYLELGFKKVRSLEYKGVQSVEIVKSPAEKH